MAAAGAERLKPTPRRLPAVVPAVALLVPLVHCLPGWQESLRDRPPREIFLGFPYMAEDHFVHASLARQTGDEGRIFVENRFTTEPQKGRFLFFYFPIVGIVTRMLGVSLPLAWDLMRVVVGFAFFLVVWRFTAAFFTSTSERLLGYVFVALSGGIGWIVRPMLTAVGAPSSVAEAPSLGLEWNWSTYASTAMPHWTAAELLLLLSALVLCGGWRLGGAWRWLAGLVLPPLCFFAHPYTGVAAYLTFVLFVAAPALVPAQAGHRLRQLRENLISALPFLVSFVFVAAYEIWARGDPVFAATNRRLLDWNRGNAVLAYPVTYGLLLPLASIGWRGSLELATPVRHLLAAWIGAAFLLAVNPVAAAVKFQYLLHLPIALLAAAGWQHLRRSQRARRIPLLILVTALFLHAPWRVVAELANGIGDPSAFISAEELEAMTFLDAQPPANVLCAYESGNRIGWISGKRVYVGHWFMTLDLERKRGEVSAFFDPAASLERKRTFLRANDVRYVYFGPGERSAGRVDPALHLQSIYRNPKVTIYRVDP
jgi:hypothetical protein